MMVRFSLRLRAPALRAAGVLLLALAYARPGGAATEPPFAGDVDFASRHPRLLFSTPELPALRARVHDGGADDEAYAFIRQRAFDVYLSAPMDSLVREDASLEPMINLALASHFENTVDSSLVNLGRRVTLYIARQWNVDTDAFGSALRLRALTIGFDHFFVHATPGERDEIRTEVQSYIITLTTSMPYDVWRHRPYVSNKTAMISASLGMAGICFQDEISWAITGSALTVADELFRIWRDAHLADDGSYREGTLYLCWSMRHLVYYFAARKRFDGFDYGTDPAVRAVERWLPYELDPRGNARVNNMNDQTDYYRPLARHSTYSAWAQSAWGSGIAAYMWEHSAGPLGKDMLDENDKASTVLWHAGVAPVNPGTVLSRSHVWGDRGLYCFRTGWPDGASSNDVVFSFYSGEFHGGHAQEDQNQFTLAAYGEKLVLDHGAGAQAKETEAHNLVRIDGNGQHNAGSSIGTDGRIVAYITTDYSDYVAGDATEAYTTHSPYNNYGVPYPSSNWSWGWYGANPVEHAIRRVIAVHGDGVPPYFVIRDDVKKDAGVHHYDWCMHTGASALIDTTGNAITITSGGASLFLYAIQPARAGVTTQLAAFDNLNEDPNSRLLTLGANAVDPHFTMLLIPLPANTAPPVATPRTIAGGAGLRLEWASGAIDEILMRTPASPGGSAIAGEIFPGTVTSDAQLAVVRTQGVQVTGYTLVAATWLSAGTTLLASVEDGPASMVFDGNDLHLDRADAHFRVRADMVNAVYYRGVLVSSYVEGDWRVSDLPTGTSPVRARGLALRTYPNPFNPSVHATFVNPARGLVRATVHDPSGRLIATLASRVMDAGAHTLDWDGRDHAAHDAASGVYFLRVSTGGQSATTKLVLLR